MCDNINSQSRDSVRTDKINVKDIQDLLLYFSKNTCSATNKDEEAVSALNRCIELFELDYHITKVPNNNGELCFQYPSLIPVIASEKSFIIYESDDDPTKVIDEQKTRELFNNAKYARCRQRFPIPVIFYKDKNICRSATLSSVPEVCYRAGISDVGFEALYALKEFLWPSEDSTTEDFSELHATMPSLREETNKNWPYCDKVRNEDIKLLKELNVNTIVDIMVEKRKLKHGLYVSSSEKVDRERYADFKMISFPYPGCEFFKKFHDNLFNAEGLVYDWNHPSNDAVLSAPESPYLRIKWDNYKNWEVITMTQNYMKYIVKSLQDDTSGLLLHCISGWDRTPLFISMLRLSLWADGLVHKALDEYQILYLTIAYDWMLFGHHLTDRLYKGEEIFYFCFYMLKFITGDDYSAKHKLKKLIDLDQDHRGSNLSLNSNGSTVDVYYTCNDELNGNPGVADVFDNISSSSSSHRSSPEFQSNGVPHSPQPRKTSPDTTPAPVTHQSRRTTPLPIGGSGRRKRTDSSGSTTSSGSWNIVTGAGSLERENFVYVTMRERKLNQVRDIFVDSYFKTVKKETYAYGPLKRTIVEDVIVFLAEKLKRT